MYTLGIRPQGIPTIQGGAPGNAFLLPVETEEGWPHCVAIEKGESGAVYVFDGSLRYQTTRDLLTSCIFLAVGRSEIVLFGPGREIQPADDILLGLRAGAADRTTSYPYKEDPEDAPSNEFLGPYTRRYANTSGIWREVPRTQRIQRESCAPGVS